MILVLEPEKLTARLILGFIIIISMIGAAFAFIYWKNKITELDTQQTTISKLTTDLNDQTVLISRLKTELTAKDSQASIATAAISQLREKNKKLETAISQCQATAKSYKDYYYYYLSNGR